jgi:hypothetical protein
VVIYTRSTGWRREDVPTALLLAKVFILAERFMMPHLQNLVMDKFQATLCALRSWGHLVSVIKFAYDADKLVDSLLRKLLADIFAFGKREDWMSWTKCLLISSISS